MNKNTAEVIEHFLQTPTAKAMAADKAKKIADQRAKHVLQRERLEAEGAAAYREHQIVLAAAMDAEIKSRKANAIAKTALQRVIQERMAASFAYDRKMTWLEGELRETADPAIEVFITEMDDAEAATMRATPIPDIRTITNLNTGRKQVVPGQPTVTPRVRLDAIRQARADAEALKLQADQSGITAQLAALRATIPTVGEPTGEPAPEAETPDAEEIRHRRDLRNLTGGVVVVSGRVK